ncbi:hypothetical protein CRE_10594 [Caenorhabditis remanei]|uniref:RING-type domain-containing protein n=1 Tax=Caenorhabditis remanei TaxID=31234 RepID=E3NBK0_CAERE|nr:hypothetical protein CRE_10594 [Caenorhabditis remanei]
MFILRDRRDLITRNRVGEFQAFIFDLWTHFSGIASFGTMLRVYFSLEDIRDKIMLTYCLAFYAITVYSRIAIFEIGVKIGRFDLQHHKKLIIASTVFPYSYYCSYSKVNYNRARYQQNIGNAMEPTGIRDYFWSHIECNICFMEFSASRIPRILKKCGHTIWVSSKLAKNHAVLEFVEGIKMDG